MATTQNEITANGSTNQFAFTFPYIKEDDVKVSLRTTNANATPIDKTKYSFPSATEIRFEQLNGATDFQAANGKPFDGVTVRIYRETDIDNPKAVYYPGSSVRAQDLNDNTLQNLYAEQERQNRAVDAIGGGVMKSNLTMEQSDIVFEGDTVNDFETTLTVVNPSADRTITLPDVSGTVITTGDVDTVTSDMLTNNIDIAGTLDVTGATVLDSTLQVEGNINAAGDLDVNGTSNLNNVDIDGSFHVQQTATFAGTVNAAGFSGDITGDVTGNVTGGVTGNVTGNVSGSSTSLLNARNIAGQSFDGTADIDISLNNLNDVNIGNPQLPDDGKVLTWDHFNSKFILESAYTSNSIANGAITTAKIADDAVTYGKMQDTATDNRVLGATTAGTIGETQVVTGMIADDAVTYGKMQDTATDNRVLGATTAGTIGETQVATGMIANDAVTNAKIADNSINSEHYVDGSIDTAHIDDHQVTYAKMQTISTDHRLLGRNNDGTEDGDADVTEVQVATDMIIDDAVTTAKIAYGAITLTKIAAGAVTLSKIAADAVTTSKIVDDAVTSAKISANAVTSTQIAADAVVPAKIVDNAVTSAKIAADAVTSAKIADDAVTYGKMQDIAAANRVLGAATAGVIQEVQVATDMIAADAVTTAKIVDDAVTTAKIVDDAVTGAKIEDNVALGGTAAFVVPKGTDVQQPDASATPAVSADSDVAGAIRYNTTDNRFEIRDDNAWRNIFGGVIDVGADQDFSDYFDVNRDEPINRAAGTGTVLIKVPYVNPSNNTHPTGQNSRVSFEAPSTNNPTVTISPPTNLASSYDLVFPADAGTLGKFLKAGGSGSLVWGDIDIVTDTTPQLGGDLDVLTSTITTTTSNGNIKLEPDGEGLIEVRGATLPGAIKLNCENNSHGVTIKSPAHSATATYTLTLPTSDGSANQLLKTNGSGALSWTDQTGEANVQSDWNAGSGDAQILNKPTNVSDFTNDAGYVTSGIALTDLSVGTEATASGDGGIVYDNTTGEFTYIPPSITTDNYTGDIVGTTGGQILQDKTLDDYAEQTNTPGTNPTSFSTATAHVFIAVYNTSTTISSITINPGQSMLIHFDIASGNNITWPTIKWVGGSAPTLNATGHTIVELWCPTGTDIYGATVGDAS